jgi:hypothetical protein
MPSARLAGRGLLPGFRVAEEHRDLLNLEHAFEQLPQVRRRHDFAINDSRRVGALIPNSRTGGTPELER